MNFKTLMIDCKPRVTHKLYFLMMLCTAVIAISAAQISNSGQVAQKVKKPNIIYLLTDDHRVNALGVMGNPIIKTPNLDQLANSGILFKQAYVTTSICCVSRASVLSGQYMSRHKIADFSTSFTAEAFSQTYPMLLKKAGYRIGFIGKFGVGQPKNQPSALFDFWSCSDKSQPDYELKDQKGNYLHHTDKVNNDIQAFLETADRDKPFCLSVSFKAPHVQDEDPRQFIPQPRFMSMYKSDSIPETEKMDPKYWNAFPDFFRTEKNFGRMRWHQRYENNSMYQESVRNYYRLISGVDEVVGKLRAALKVKGLDDNTVIIFMGDNGFYLGEYGLADKWYGHQESIRVPLILFDPRKKTDAGKKVNDMVLNIDIAPTILGLSDVSVPRTMQGTDLATVASGKVKGPKRADFFYEHTFMGSPGIPKVEGVVGYKRKYMKYIEHDYEELFDLVKDPDEKHNVASDEQYKEVLNASRKRYMELKSAVK